MSFYVDSCRLPHRVFVPGADARDLDAQPASGSLADDSPGRAVRIDPPVPTAEYFDLHGNRCVRTVVGPGLSTFGNDAIVEDCGLPDSASVDRAASERARLAARGHSVSVGEPLLRSRQRVERIRLGELHAYAAGLAARAGRVRLRASTRSLRLPASPTRRERPSMRIANESASAAITCTWRSRSAVA